MGILLIVSLLLGALVLLAAASQMKKVAGKAKDTGLLDAKGTHLPIQNVAWAVVLLMLASLVLVISRFDSPFGSSATGVDSLTANVKSGTTQQGKDDLWHGPDESTMPAGKAGELVKYGKELIAHTSKYLGPKGSVKSISNGMNCNNCHLDAGTRAWGNNYAAVYSTYPKFRERSGSTETIYKRVNDCFERSLNGQPLDTNSKEMKAIYAYIQWLGTGTARGGKPKGTGIVELAYMDRAADPEKGKAVYVAKCQSCHQADGQGTLNMDKTEYTYPPLWGKNSYNHGAGLYRLSRFAGYVKANMPLGATHQSPQLTDEEAWDVAAYVNSQPRPGKDLSADWPKIAAKPIDHPFGPFADGFDENQHKYGPFGPIKKKRNLQK
jgi:thiosulfate dehydrogenase